MKVLRKVYWYSIYKVVGLNNIGRLITYLSKAANLDLLDLAHQNMGIGKYDQEMILSGELNFIENILPEILGGKNKESTLFDVGANNGNFTQLLLRVFSAPKIHAFEPNPKTFETLATFSSEKVVVNNLALSNYTGKSILFDADYDTHGEHATMHSGVFETNQIAAFQIPIETLTLQEYCIENQINQIDFLKIDTEGHEFFVLQGAKGLIDTQKIKVIFFEFNEMNVASNVFLKNYYELLKDYDLYRLDTRKLISLKNYSTRNEIFRFQNIIAVSKALNFKY